jgi:heme-degrading monooxygenase HmoA
MENLNAVAQDSHVSTEARSGARVLVFYRAPANDPAVVERIYHQVSAEMRGTPGLVGNQLIKDVTDPGSYVVASDWADMSAFAAWDKSTGHRRTTPLDPYQDADPSRRKHFGIYQVVARY